MGDSTQAVEITTREAADLMHVTHSNLVQLLERGEILHRKVGTRRRVLFADVEAYRRRDDARRGKILGELTREAEDLDLGY